MPHFKTARVYSSFRYILWLFIIIAVIIVAIILLYYCSSARIIITIPNADKTITKEFTLSDSPKKLKSGLTYGEIINTTIDATETLKPLMQDKITYHLEPTITIINNTSNDQPLVSGTRLLSDDNILFRTKESITILSNSQITVKTAMANQDDIKDLPAQKFTIVALNTSLQDKIFGETFIDQTSHASATKIISNDAYEILRSNLEKKLLTNGLAKLEKKLPANTQILKNLLLKEMTAYSSQIISNQNRDKISATGTMRLTAVALDIKEIKKQLLTEQENMVSSDKMDSENNHLKIKLTELNLKENTAKISAEISFIPEEKTLNSFVFKSLSGKTSSEINKYLKKAIYATDVRVKMWPIELPILITPQNNIKIEYVTTTN